MFWWGPQRGLNLCSVLCRRQAGICTGMRLRLLMGSHACAGLSAMHARGWAHYDIKPANILVFMEGGLEVGKLCDLGAAREFDATMGLADTGGNLLCVLSNPRCQPCSCSSVTRPFPPGGCAVAGMACRVHISGPHAPLIHKDISG